jgi:hypothetical protein
MYVVATTSVFTSASLFSMAETNTWLGRSAVIVAATATSVGQVGATSRRIATVRRIVPTVNTVDSRRSR